MLRLHRRHLKSCPHRSLSYRRCKCPVWIMGSLDGKRIRRALDTTSWDAGEEILRELDPQEVFEAMSVTAACDRFLADCKARELGPAQMGKYGLLSEELKREFPNRAVRSVTSDDLRTYREKWKVAPVTAYKKLERLRSFFRFCHDSGWIRQNPAKALKPPKVKQTPTIPFTDSQIEKIMWATELYA